LSIFTVETLFIDKSKGADKERVFLNMIERGKIVNIENDHATVEMAEGKECAGCRLCTGIGGKRQLKVALDQADLFKAGQVVEIEISSRETLLGGFFVFILPLIAFIIGAMHGPKIFKLFNISIGAELAAMSAGFLLLSVSLAAATALYRSKRKKQKLKTRIRIVQ